MHGHMSRCTVTCHDARSHVTIHGHMSRCTVTWTYNISIHFEHPAELPHMSRCTVTWPYNISTDFEHPAELPHISPSNVWHDSVSNWQSLGINIYATLRNQRFPACTVLTNNTLFTIIHQKVCGTKLTSHNTSYFVEQLQFMFLHITSCTVKIRLEDMDNF